MASGQVAAFEILRFSKCYHDRARTGCPTTYTPPSVRRGVKDLVPNCLPLPWLRRCGLGME